jgi:hypothetical protein
MPRSRALLRKILVQALVVLLLCVLVALEFPELLILTDDTTNDFTVRRTNAIDLLDLQDSSGHLGIPGIDSSALVLEPRLSPPGPFEEAVVPSSDLSILHSVLRT